MVEGATMNNFVPLTAGLNFELRKTLFLVFNPKFIIHNSKFVSKLAVLGVVALTLSACGGNAPEEKGAAREGRPEPKTAVVKTVVSVREKTLSSLALADMKPVTQALAAYALQEGSVPEGDSADALDALVPDYIARIPSADPWGTPYFYQSDGRNFELRSAGDDLAFRTDDDVVVTGP